MAGIRICALTWSFAVLLAGIAASATAQQELFTYRERVFDASSIREPAVVVDYRVRFDVTALSASVFLPVHLTLPNGERYELLPEAIEDRGRNSLLWRGRVVGVDDEGQLIVTVHRGHVAGLLSLPGRTYGLVPDAEGAGVSRFRELESSLFPAALDTVEPSLPADESAVAPRDAIPEVFIGESVVEVLIVYTPAARAAAGGTAQIEAFAQAAVDVSNLAYGNSQVVNLSLELRGSEQIGYNENGVPLSAQLAWLRNSPGVGAMRDAYAADLVSMFSESPPGCGIAYAMRSPGPLFEPFGYSVIHRPCAVGNFSFAHELGHNMGLEHDPANSDVDPAEASFPWSFGHFVDGEFRTVMTYPSACSDPFECPRIAHFSNPDVFFSGHPTGIENQRDNARTLNLTAPIVEDFRDFVTFVDVPRSHFAWASIENVYGAGVTGGCGVDPLIYCPGSPVSRSQMAVFLLKSYEGPDYDPPPATGVFDDVPVGNPFAPWIEELAARDITGGCSAQPPLFCPTDPVTRAQMAIFLLKGLLGGEYMPPPATGIFDDVPANSPAAPWIEELANREITGGCSASPPLFCPGDAVSRAQMAVFLANTFLLSPPI